MGKAIKVLFVEDSPDDAELAVRALKRAGYEPEYERVDSPEAMRKALEREWDIILSDHEMPRFSAPDALRLLKETGRDIPFIILSGAITVELAGEAMREGARDFIPKNRLSLLGPAIERELDEFRTRRDNLRAEEELKQAEAKYRDLYENAPDIFFSVNAETGRVTDCNETTVKLTGFSRDEIIEHPVFERYHTDCIEEVKAKWFPLFQRAGEVRNAELQMRTKDGGKMYILLNVTGVYDENGKLLYSRSVCRDITERKEAEAERNRLAVGIEQAGEAIVITDTDANIIYVNPQFEKNTGYSREEAIGKNPRILKSEKQSDAFYKNLWAVITAGKVWKGHFVNRKKDGSLFDEEATISPVFDDKGEIVSYVAVKRDITETAMLERSREHFTTITSHELKTPQVKLQLGIERLKSLKQGEFDRERFDDALKALEETEHDFNHIITGALLLAKLSEPVTSDMMEENYIFSHIESAVYKTRSLMAKEKRNVEIELDTSRLPARTGVYGNRRMISRAIEEILSNAVKYTPDGKKVTVTARADEKKAVILISDEGPGVPEAQKKAALDAYSSLENTLHHSTGRYIYEGGGLGLGLTLTRLIMDHHHGRMEICSGGTEPGTTVVLSFPTIGRGNRGKD